MALQYTYELDADEQALTLFKGIFGRYFESLDCDLREGQALIPIIGQRPQDKYRRSTYSADIYLAACYVSELCERGEDVFFAVNPRRTPRLLKSAIPHILTLHVDVDSQDLQVERRIRDFNPSAIVSSGYGFHCYFFLQDPVAASTYHKVAEELNRNLANLLDGDTGAIYVSHALRVPGTINRKRRSNPRQVELVYFDGTARYPLDYYVDRFSTRSLNLAIESGLRLVEKCQEAERESGGSKSSERDDKRGHFLSPEERLYLYELLKTGLFERSSRNRAILILIRYCYERGMSVEGTQTWVIRFFDERHNEMSRDWRSHRRYCINQIRSAITNWWRKAYQPVAAMVETKNLSEADLKWIDSLAIKDRDKEFVTDALTYILNAKRNDVIFLTARNVRRFRSGRDYRRQLALLKRLGIIEVISEAKRKDRLAAEYRVRYEFKAGVDGGATPERKRLGDRICSRIMTGESNSEIKKQIPQASNQNIYYHRKRMEKMNTRDEFLED